MMMTDENIKEFFHKNRPATSDNGTYLAALKSKLDAIEEVKRIHDIEVAKCRKQTTLAFIFGVLLGGAVLAVIISLPPFALRQDMTWLVSIVTFVNKWKPLFVAGIAVSALVLGLIPWNKIGRNYSIYIH